MVPAQALNPVLARHDARLGKLIGDETVPKRGIAAVDVSGGVHQMRIRPVTFRDRADSPPVGTLLAESQHPAGSNRRLRFFSSCISADSAAAGPAPESLRSAMAIQRFNVVTESPKSFTICASGASPLRATSSAR